mmetsp:Transcript_10180/g.15192  ORF Transcript_10180/g.15192 Transcript_10180/m.15192 type:complete len:100 (-) Transcript_10180:2-301(-)
MCQRLTSQHAHFVDLYGFAFKTDSPSFQIFSSSILIFLGFDTQIEHARRGVGSVERHDWFVGFVASPTLLACCLLLHQKLLVAVATRFWLSSEVRNINE